jgi:hypothetical protein
VLFGAYICAQLENGNYVAHEIGLFYRDGHSEEFRIFKRFVKGSAYELGSVEDFRRTIFLKYLKAGALIVAYDVPFQISRIAVKWNKSLKHRRAFSFYFRLFKDKETGKLRPSPFDPGLSIESLDASKAICRLIRYKFHDGDADREEEPQSNVHVLDLKTLTAVLTGEAQSFSSASEIFGTPASRTRNIHSRVTKPAIERVLRDVTGQLELLNRLRRELQNHSRELAPERCYSPATLAKHYFSEMGIQPPQGKFNITDHISGIAEQSFFAGRAETAAVRTPLPVTYVDFFSQFPAISSLLDCRGILCAQNLDFPDFTNGARNITERATVTVKCSSGFGNQTTYTSTYTYIDSAGRSHPFPGSTSYTQTSGGCGSTTTYGSPLTGAQATDDSGYVITANANFTGDTVTTRSGIVVATNVGSNSGSGTYKDTNGNELTVNNSTGQFFDTLSGTTAVLTQTGSGTPSSPIKYTYTAPSGGNAAYTVNYTQYTVATNFGISGIAEYGALSNALVSSITLPDGSHYSFTYEKTPGTCTPLSGTYSSNCVTGRMASITLPTGGTVTYGYTGGSNGILSDGSTAGVTRTLSPGGLWQYSRTMVSGSPAPGSTWTTTGIDPNNNYTVINFAEDGSTGTGATYNFYETQWQAYQGSVAPSNLLATNIRCYNTNYANCSTATVSSPITQTDIYSELPNASTRLSERVYNSYGLVTDDKEYDYGVTMGAAPGTTHLIRETGIDYASLANGIVDRPSSIGETDWTTGQPLLKAGASFYYDETTPTATSGTPQHVAISGTARGNLTTLTPSSLALSLTWTYYDTGNPNVATDVNGAQTTYQQEGVVYADGLDQESVELIRSFANSNRAKVEDGCPPGIGCESRTQFVNGEFWDALRMGACIVCFNSPFDLSRLALEYRPSKAKNSGWSMVLWKDRGKPDEHKPRLKIEPKDSRSAFFELAGGEAGERVVYRGRFLDLSVLCWARGCIRDHSAGLSCNGQTDSVKSGL